MQRRSLLVLVALSIAAPAQARPFRVTQVPNGPHAGCLTCHTFPGGPRNSFGRTIEIYGQEGFLDAGGNVMWGTKAIALPGEPARTLAQIDSDGDGRTNGEELLDPTDVWRIGATHPGDPALVRVPSARDASVVIRQVYASGGASASLFRNDFVELFNRSSAPVSLSGWSLQFAPASGAGTFGDSSSAITALPDVVLQPGQSFLAQLASDGGGGATLPFSDVFDATPAALGDLGAKIVLVSTTASLGCNGNPTLCTGAALDRIIDLVGYGSANYYEGPTLGPAPPLSPTTALLRARNGCTDIGANGSMHPSVPADLALGTPVPRGMSSPLAPCATTQVVAVSALGGWTPALVAVLLAAGSLARRRKLGGGRSELRA